MVIITNRHEYDKDGPERLKNGRLRLEPPQILVLGFAAVILLGTFLLMLPISTRSGENAGFLNALFTATSAVCVTGLVVVDTGTYWSTFGQAVVMMLIQAGGLGFMTVATMIFMALGKRINLRERLVIQEQLNQYTLQGVVRLTKYIILGTLMIEGIGAILLSIRFVPELGFARGIYYGIFHAVSAFCNAGFDIIGEYRSLTPYVSDFVVSGVVVTLFITGGLGFSVLAEVTQLRRFRRLSLHTKLVLSITGILLALGTVLIFVFEYTNPATLKPLPFAAKVLSSFFHSAAPRTAGFNTLSTADLTNASKFLSIVLMFIGGSPGSTAGGIKTTTAGVLIWTVVSVIKGREDTEIYNRRITKDIIYRSLSVAIISMLLIILTVTILSLTEAASFIEVFFETTSAFGTVGLSLGITPHLSPIGKVMIIITMYAGRVGPLTIAFALAQRQRRSRGKLRYPEEKILVG
ncbi:MAG: KtrAB potassium uptake system, integral membrane component KtrB [Firmicutes bacterium]|nr:KtrAB potassium uptake system, integral membrane component KtrB [Bacillota bacterium]